MFKPGDVVFFNTARRSSARKTVEGRFRGHGFGILLGVVPPFAKDPIQGDLMRMMGSIGYLSFDDIGDFFGPEIGAECVKKFEDKYYPKTQAVPPSEGKNQDDELRGIIPSVGTETGENHTQIDTPAGQLS